MLKTKARDIKHVTCSAIRVKSKISKKWVNEVMHRGTPYQLNVISDFSPMHQACNFHCINIILKAHYTASTSQI